MFYTLYFWLNRENRKRKVNALEFCYENNFMGINRGRHLCVHLLLLVIAMIEAFSIRKDNLRASCAIC